MKPKKLQTKIFLDSGDPEETKQALKLLGFLNGQTTNPSLIAKSPEAKKRLEAGDKFSREEINEFYKKTVTEISNLIPEGSVSVEVYADKNTSADDMIEQAKEMNTWIPNAHIKLPTTSAGLEAASKLIWEGVRINMTLVFSQEQAAAVYAATKAVKKGSVFVSPFEGRLHDKCHDGMDLIENIAEMYDSGDKHVRVLAASIRDLAHFLYVLHARIDIVTAPFEVLKEWHEAGMNVPGEFDEKFKDENEYFKKYHDPCVTDIPYERIHLGKPWQEYDIKHELTDSGLQKFADDWNALLK